MPVIGNGHAPFIFGANLRGATLYGANLRGAILTRANLSGADLNRADLFGAILTRAILDEADLVLDCIEDPYLRQQVKAGRIDNSASLFWCAGAAESAQGQPFKGDPANTLGSYLREEFRKLPGWDWPKNPPEWKQHFIEYHADVFSQEAAKGTNNA